MFIQAAMCASLFARSMNATMHALAHTHTHTQSGMHMPIALHTCIIARVRAHVHALNSCVQEISIYYTCINMSPHAWRCTHPYSNVWQVIAFSHRRFATSPRMKVPAFGVLCFRLVKYCTYPSCVFFSGCNEKHMIHK